jgi:hypothetical protein
VEFALVMPILFLILFGMVEFGINMNDYQSIRQGVRDGARTAVVADYGTGSCTPTATTAAANSAAVICQTKLNAGTGGLTVMVKFTNNNGDSNFDTDKVKVCAVAPAKSITGLLAPFLKDVYLKSSVEMRAEKDLKLDSVAPTPVPSDPSGGNWSWC